MRNFIIKIGFPAMVTLCLLWGPVGCGEDEASAPAKPKVVATKIKVAAAKTPKAKTSAGKAKQGPQKSVVAGKPATAATPGGTKAPVTNEGDAAVIQKTMETIKKEAAAGADAIYRARLYDPEGKLDPFESPFGKEESKQVAEEEPEPQEPKRIRQTPLERIALSQLRLVGIIKFPSGHKAIVEEQSGKGYMVKKGTYIGTNYGRVVEILMDRIVIQEQVKDYLGKYKDQKSQLKLQKPLGEN